MIARIIGCETYEKCQKIQQGNIILRRLGKLSVLFTAAIVLIINDMITWIIEKIIRQYKTLKESYENATGSALYRWTVGWFNPPKEIPDFDKNLIFLYNLINFSQLAFFAVFLIWCLRWLYADSVCRSKGLISFYFLLISAFFTNLIIYFTLRHFIFSLL